MTNDYYIVLGKVYIVIRDRAGVPVDCAIVSECDVGRANELPGGWFLDGRGYVRGNLPRSKNRSRSVKLHRWLLSPKRGLVVDHINHDGLDCRRENLRLTTNAENQQNRVTSNKNSRSGIRGVCRDSRSSKWRAYMRISGRQKFLGNYNTPDEAQRAVEEARARFMPFSQEALPNGILYEEVSADDVA